MFTNLYKLINTVKGNCELNELQITFITYDMLHRVYNKQQYKLKFVVWLYKYGSNAIDGKKLTTATNR